MLPFLDDLLGLPSKFYRHVCQQLGDTKVLVHVLVIIFATSSWADMNGLWVELPLLVLEAPEGWDLPSYITIISQVANIGPLLFVGLSVVLPHTKHKLEKYASFTIIIIGILSAFLLAFYWQDTSYVGGTKHSTALLVLNFFLALGDCTSSVCFYAFMSLLKPQYMASLLLGEGLSGMLPAMVALGQGAGDIVCVNTSHTTNHTDKNGTHYNVTTYSLSPQYVQPHFSVQIFFFVLTAILASSGIAFLLLNILPACRSEIVDPTAFEYERIIHENVEDVDCDSIQTQPNNQHEQIREQHKSKDSYGAVHAHQNTSIESQTSSTAFQNGHSRNHHRRVATPPSSNTSTHMSLTACLHMPDISLCHLVTLLSIIIVINLTLTSFLSTIQIYSTLPYGLQPYHLTTTLVAIANPVACFIALLVMTKRLASISAITLLGLVGVAYIVYLAVESPKPPLHGQDAGSVLAVGTWIVTTLLLIYAKVCVAGVMREHGRNGLIWAGVATQVGSLIGALVGFLLTQYTHVFVQAQYC